MYFGLECCHSGGGLSESVRHGRLMQTREAEKKMENAPSSHAFEFICAQVQSQPSRSPVWKQQGGTSRDPVAIKPSSSGSIHRNATFILACKLQPFPMSLTRSASGLGETRHERAAMPSRSSSCTRSTQSTQQAAFPTCFPTARALAPEADLKTLPQRPRWKDPILDPASCSIPIRQFDEQSHSCFYAKRQAGVEADLPSAQPEHFADNYLMPSLTHNERLRLTMRECPRASYLLRTYLVPT